MAAVSGSIQEISIRGRNFAVAADADADRALGGFTNDVQANGNGSARLVKKRVPWKIGGLTLSVDDGRADHEFLQSISDANDFVTITITLVSGLTYQGLGIITDDFNYSTEKGTSGVTLMGPQKLTQQ